MQFTPEEQRVALSPKPQPAPASCCKCGYLVTGTAVFGFTSGQHCLARGCRTAQAAAAQPLQSKGLLHFLWLTQSLSAEVGNSLVLLPLPE